MTDDIIKIPNQETDEEVYQVNRTEIKSKKGNYIFTVGNVTSGKSCIQSMLVHRLMNRRDISLSFSNKKGEDIHDYLLNEVIRKIDNGDLPDRTAQGKIQEFNIRFVPENLKPLEFNFLEISGEDIKTIIPSGERNNKPSLNENLTLYLRTPKVKKSFIFVADATRTKLNHELKDNPSEDVLFNMLISHFLSKAIGLKNIHILFLVSKWDKVESEYVSVRQYINDHFPQTMALLNSQSNYFQVTYAPYSLGDVVVEKRNGRLKPTLIRIEPSYTDTVLRWLYKTHTGKILPPENHKKKTFFDYFRELFS